MKKIFIIVLSIIYAVNMSACFKLTETVKGSGTVNHSETINSSTLEECSKSISFMDLATRNQRKEESSKKKKSIRLEDENTKSKSDADMEQIVKEEYRDLFAGGSFDADLVWTCDNPEYSELTESLQEYCEKLPGSFMLATDDEIIFAGGFNAMEIDEKTKVNSFTTYEIGSITQQFMSAAIMQQVQKGNLKTGDTIDKFFPDYDHGDQITVDHLLHMSSGIPDFLNESNKFFKGRTAEQYDAFMNGRMTDEEMLGFLYHAPLNFEPGKKAGYSNTDYYLLALILEQVTGETYEAYMQKNILEPCGLQATTCLETGNLTCAPEGNEAYMAIGKACRGVGDMHSNLCDILRWNRALLSGKVVDEAWLDELLDLSEGFNCGFMDMGDGAMATISMTEGYGAVDVIYQNNGEPFYLICMTSHARSVLAVENIHEIILNYLDE